MAAPRGTCPSHPPRPLRPRREGREGAPLHQQGHQRRVAAEGETGTHIATITGTAATGMSTAGKKQVSSARGSRRRARRIAGVERLEEGNECMHRVGVL